MSNKADRIPAVELVRGAHAQLEELINDVLARRGSAVVLAGVVIRHGVIERIRYLVEGDETRRVIPGDHAARP